MKYKFQCPECKRYIDVDIPMSEYEEQKDKQICAACLALDSNQVLLQRVIEWNGCASGSGDGWFGRSDGCKSI